ncbi:hypothetical protein D3C73_1487690 [compost metagenome]
MANRQLDGRITLDDGNQLGRLVPIHFVPEILRDHPQRHHDSPVHILDRNALPCGDLFAVEEDLVVSRSGVSMFRHHEYEQ